MNRNDDLTCDTALDLIEPYVDGELEPAEAARLRSHLESCRSCAAEWMLAARIQRELHALPQLDCPPEIVERVRREGAQVLPFRPAGSSVDSRRAVLPFRIAAAAALVALALGGGAFFVRRQQQQAQAAEVARATQEARFALAYFGKVSREASRDVRDDVLGRRVVLRATHSVSRTLGISFGAAPEKPALVRGEQHP
jgi:anti-sigma factor RsiW